MNRRTTLATFATCSALVFSLINCPFANAGNNPNSVFHLPTMGAGPQPISIYLILATVGILVVLIAVAAALAYRKLRKIIAAAALVLVVTIAAVGFVWFTEASINYSLSSAYSYPRVSDNYLTINCENNGYMVGTFSLVVQFTNANLSTKTNQPYQQLDSSTAKFIFTLQSGEKQNTKVYFTINDNATDFYISLTFQPSSNSFLMKSDSVGDTYRSYQKDANDDNFTERITPPPP